MSDKNISKEARIFVRKNKQLLIEKFSDLKLFPPNNNPFSIFMAGSPGAGKTELSKSLLSLFLKLDPPAYTTRIDADEIKESIPQYNGKNSDEVHSASILGVEILYDYALNNQQSAIVDGTLANYGKAYDNISRSLQKNRKVGIFYLYQDPLIAWDFTKKRGELEGRIIPKEFFIESFFAAKKNVNKIKSEFRDKIIVTVAIKNQLNEVAGYKINVGDVDSYLRIDYTKKSLNSKLC